MYEICKICQNRISELKLDLRPTYGCYNFGCSSFNKFKMFIKRSCNVCINECHDTTCRFDVKNGKAIRRTLEEQKKLQEHWHKECKGCSDNFNNFVLRKNSLYDNEMCDKCIFKVDDDCTWDIPKEINPGWPGENYIGFRDTPVVIEQIKRLLEELS